MNIFGIIEINQNVACVSLVSAVASLYVISCLFVSLVVIRDVIENTTKSIVWRGGRVGRSATNKEHVVAAGVRCEHPGNHILDNLQ